MFVVLGDDICYKIPSHNVCSFSKKIYPSASLVSWLVLLTQDFFIEINKYFSYKLRTFRMLAHRRRYVNKNFDFVLHVLSRPSSSYIEVGCGANSRLSMSLKIQCRYIWVQGTSIYDLRIIYSFDTLSCDVHCFHSSFNWFLDSDFMDCAKEDTEFLLRCYGQPKLNTLTNSRKSWWKSTNTKWQTTNTKWKTVLPQSWNHSLPHTWSWNHSAPEM